MLCITNSKCFPVRCLVLALLLLYIQPSRCNSGIEQNLPYIRTVKLTWKYPPASTTFEEIASTFYGSIQGNSLGVCEAIGNGAVDSVKTLFDVAVQGFDAVGLSTDSLEELQDLLFVGSFLI